MKAAYVNKTTGIVENIIVVDSLEDSVDDEHVLAEIPMIEVDYTEDELDLYNLLQQIDPEFVYPSKKRVEPAIEIGVTKWNSNDEFYE